MQQPEDEPGVEDVSGAGGIDHWNAICGSVVESLSIPGQHAVPGPEWQRRARSHSGPAIRRSAVSKSASAINRQGKSRLTMR